MVLVMVMRPAGQRRTLSANPHLTQSKTGPRGETHTAGGKDAVVPVPGLQAAGAAVADELLGAGVVLRGGAPPVPGVSSGGGGLGVRGAPGVLHRPALPGAHPSGAPAACSAGVRLGWVGLSASTQSSVIPVIPRDGGPRGLSTSSESGGRGAQWAVVEGVGASVGTSVDVDGSLNVDPPWG